jgi:hypothetical protein
MCQAFIWLFRLKVGMFLVALRKRGGTTAEDWLREAPQSSSRPSAAFVYSISYGGLRVSSVRDLSASLATIPFPDPVPWKRPRALGNSRIPGNCLVRPTGPVEPESSVREGSSFVSKTG